MSSCPCLCPSNGVSTPLANLRLSLFMSHYQRHTIKKKVSLAHFLLFPSVTSATAQKSAFSPQLACYGPSPTELCVTSTEAAAPGHFLRKSNVLPVLFPADTQRCLLQHSCPTELTLGRVLPPFLPLYPASFPSRLSFHEMF